MRYRSFFVLLGLALTVASTMVRPALGTEPQRRAEMHFERMVAPLLVEHCIQCHSGLKPKSGLDLTTIEGSRKGGKQGPAIVPGDLQDSILWRRISAGEMPPRSPLPEADRAVLKAWIEEGAVWGSKPIVPTGVVASDDTTSDWWSLQPLRRPSIPATDATGGARNPIDPFILAKLKEKGLQPSPEADRRTLIRRVYFDLIGLPPAPDEVEAFIADADPQAYEKLVDRLLASPHYGERWARHWLDVVHYGETHGYDKDKPRENAWPYRDYVIRAFKM